ncbi:hypothetical protein SLE2022_033370 [Rubroshorea leprosula]
MTIPGVFSSDVAISSPAGWSQAICQAVSHRISQTLPSATTCREGRRARSRKPAPSDGDVGVRERCRGETEAEGEAPRCEIRWRHQKEEEETRASPLFQLSHGRISPLFRLTGGKTGFLTNHPEDDIDENEWGGSRDNAYDDCLTLAERKFLQQTEKLELQRLAKMASRSHRDRIQEFNQYLANVIGSMGLGWISEFQRCIVNSLDISLFVFGLLYHVNQLSENLCVKNFFIELDGFNKLCSSDGPPEYLISASLSIRTHTCTSTGSPWFAMDALIRKKMTTFHF